jgi:cyclic pyranopterin phosphate synthase
MPAEGLDWIPSSTILTDDEIVRLVGIAVVRLGVRKVRFTGGEPLLRPRLVDLIRRCAQISADDGGPAELSLTTNGLRLAPVAQALADAGLARVNVSLDSLDPGRYRALTRRGDLDQVLGGLDAAAAAGLGPVKVNTVAMRGQNDVDIVPLAEFCLARGYQLRFIEHMPLGPRHTWDLSAVLSAEEILERLGERFTLTPVPRSDAAPAELWQVSATGDLPAGRIGIIASVTTPFCKSCDRTRLTADGQIMNCLFSQVETDLLGPLRAGADDDAIVDLWVGAHRDKLYGHRIGESDFTPPERTMGAIGG